MGLTLLLGDLARRPRQPADSAVGLELEIEAAGVARRIDNDAIVVPMYALRGNGHSIHRQADDIAAPESHGKWTAIVVRGDRIRGHRRRGKAGRDCSHSSKQGNDHRHRDNSPWLMRPRALCIENPPNTSYRQRFTR